MTDEDDDYLFRQPWEEPDDGGSDPPAHRSPQTKVSAAPLLIPLVRAQDAVARLEAATAAAAPDVAAGLRARLALFEAAGYLAHQGPTVHPHDLALRDAKLTGSYVLAALRGRLKAEAPWTTEEADDPDAVADDHYVAQGLAFGRRWRSLVELSTVDPLKSLATIVKAVSFMGTDLVEDEATLEWLVSLPGPSQLPGLLATCSVVAAGPPGRPRGDRLDLGPSYVAAALWRRHGYGRSCALTFWSAPTSRVDALARSGGIDFQRGYLECVTEAALRGSRELSRLHTAARKVESLTTTSRSRLVQAAAVAMREPVVTGSLLARKLDVSLRAGLDLACRLVEAGVLREMTGRKAWRAFAIV